MLATLRLSHDDGEALQLRFAAKEGAQDDSQPVEVVLGVAGRPGAEKLASAIVELDVKANTGLNSSPVLVHTGILAQVFAPGLDALDLTQREAMCSPAVAVGANAELRTIELDGKA